MSSIYFEFVPIFKAFSDETRLKIIDMLSCKEMCACDILEKVHISQSTLSYHMKALIECGIINGVKDGSWMRYSLNQNKVLEFQSFLSNITKEKLECICNEVSLFEKTDKQYCETKNRKG